VGHYWQGFTCLCIAYETFGKGCRCLDVHSALKWFAPLYRASAHPSLIPFLHLRVGEGDRLFYFLSLPDVDSLYTLGCASHARISFALSATPNPPHHCRRHAGRLSHRWRRRAGNAATEWSHAICREMVDAMLLTHDCRPESVSRRTVLTHKS
jgi:hypothetical protein